MVHEVSRAWKIHIDCSCTLSRTSTDRMRSQPQQDIVSPSVHTSQQRFVALHQCLTRKRVRTNLKCSSRRRRLLDPSCLSRRRCIDGLHSVAVERLLTEPVVVDLPSIELRLSTTGDLYPSVRHTWLDNGRLLQLLEPNNPSNLQLFQVPSSSYSYVLFVLSHGLGSFTG